MMSDLPGEITKQILSAPPRIMRSTRYSLTAHGRSVPASRRLPTGRSSFEKASGWMRLPRPAAGTMPHMVLYPYCFGGRAGAGRPCGGKQALELLGAPVRRMLGEDTLASGSRNRPQVVR